MNIQASESIKELAAALCKFQGEVEDISKTRTGVHNSKYASLGDVYDAIKTPLLDNKLVVTQFPVGEHGLATRLMHATSGEWMESTYFMTPTQSTPQQEGAVITYQRRYALGAILGLNIEKDDDGESASKGKPVQANQAINDPF